MGNVGLVGGGMTTCKNSCGIGQGQDTVTVNPYAQNDTPNREGYKFPESGILDAEPWEREKERERERDQENDTGDVFDLAKAPGGHSSAATSSGHLKVNTSQMQEGFPEVITEGNGDAAGGDVGGGSSASTAGASHHPGESYGAPGNTESYWTSYFGREAAELRRLPPPAAGAKNGSRRRHTFRTGAVYDGEWLGNERCGFGVQTWPDGAEYRGEWRQNTATGKGCFRHCDGDVYMGQWRQNMAHGCGIYLHRDGTAYRGEFLDDLQDGNGIESWPDRSQFQGRFNQGKKSGNGIYKWPDGSQYVGQWSGNQIDGHGSYLGIDGRRYDGKWRASAMHGCGRYLWPDGKTYSGQYILDQKDGFGTLTWSDGRRYQGFWVAGSQHGLGFIIELHAVKGKLASRLARWKTGERVAWIDKNETAGESAGQNDSDIPADPLPTAPLPTSIRPSTPLASQTFGALDSPVANARDAPLEDFPFTPGGQDSPIFIPPPDRSERAAM